MDVNNKPSVKLSGSLTTQSRAILTALYPYTHHRILTVLPFPHRNNNEALPGTHTCLQGSSAVSGVQLAPSRCINKAQFEWERSTASKKAFPMSSDPSLFCAHNLYTWSTRFYLNISAWNSRLTALLFLLFIFKFIQLVNSSNKKSKFMPWIL